LTLGLYWAIWFAAVESEILYHTQGAVAVRKWARVRAVASLVPILNVFMTYRLAVQIREMEIQNKYRRVSTLAAAVLAVVPPFALVYLQSAVNRHWLLHAKHLVMKRRAQATTEPVGA
jgi:hypothetical protein